MCITNVWKGTSMPDQPTECPICGTTMPGKCLARESGYDDCEWIERAAEAHPWMFPERGETNDAAE